MHSNSVWFSWLPGLELINVTTVVAFSCGRWVWLVALISHPQGMGWDSDGSASRRGIEKLGETD